MVTHPAAVNPIPNRTPQIIVVADRPPEDRLPNTPSVSHHSATAASSNLISAMLDGERGSQEVRASIDIEPTSAGAERRNGQALQTKSVGERQRASPGAAYRGSAAARR